MEGAWSATRARTFSECQRKYYYRYHLAPLARQPEPPARAKAADRVKDLIGLEAWTGDLVHRLIEVVLNRWRAGKPLPEAELMAQARQQLSRAFRESQAWWDAQPDEFRYRPTLLDFHYYNDSGVSREKAAEVKEKVTTSLRSFLYSELADQIRRVGRAQWLPIDRNAAARLPDGTLVLVKPDFAFRDGEYLHVVDWKTGKPDSYWERVQLTGYALYAQEKWDVSLPQGIPRVVHLYPEFSESETEFTPHTVWEVLTMIRDSQEDLQAVLAGGNPREEAFAITPEARRCRWCPFRGMCDGAQRCRDG